MINTYYPKSFFYNQIFPVVILLNLYVSNLNNHMEFSSFIAILLLSFFELDYLQNNDKYLFDFSFKEFPVLYQSYLFYVSFGLVIMGINTYMTGVNQNSYLMMSCFLILVSKFFILHDIKHKFND